MSLTRRAAVIGVVLVFALCRQGRPSTVCASSSDRERLNESAATFVGVPVVMMLKETKYAAPNESTTVMVSRLVKFRVSHAWKGVQSPSVWVVWGPRETESDTILVVGREYLVFATRTTDGQLATYHCAVRDLARGWEEARVLERALGPAVKKYAHDPGNEPVTCDP